MTSLREKNLKVLRMVSAITVGTVVLVVGGITYQSYFPPRTGRIIATPPVVPVHSAAAAPAIVIPLRPTTEQPKSAVPVPVDQAETLKVADVKAFDAFARALVNADGIADNRRLSADECYDQASCDPTYRYGKLKSAKEALSDLRDQYRDPTLAAPKLHNKSALRFATEAKKIAVENVRLQFRYVRLDETLIDSDDPKPSQVFDLKVLGRKIEANRDSVKSALLAAWGDLGVDLKHVDLNSYGYVPDVAATPDSSISK